MNSQVLTQIPIAIPLPVPMHAQTNMPDAVHPKSDGPPEPQSRVCDTCRIRKCKCSNERPTCASCRDNGWQCTYSLKRKRPGPVPGSRRKKQPGSHIFTKPFSTGQLSNDRSPPVVSAAVSREFPSYPSGPSWGLHGNRARSATGLYSRHEHTHTTSSDMQMTSKDEMLSDESCIAWLNQHQNQLIMLFFEYVNPVLPFVDQDAFEDPAQLDKMPRYLVLIMAALAVRFMPRSIPRFADDSAMVAMSVKLSRQAIRELEAVFELQLPTSVLEVQAAVLLTLFEYARRPGRRAWEQTGRISRMAFGCRLHQIDDDDNNTSDKGGLPAKSTEERDLQRNLWWGIWRLDSYAAIVTGTSINISRNEIKTNFPGRPKGVGEHRISGNVADIWKSIFLNENIHAENTIRNMFVLSNSLLRETSLISRLMRSGKQYDTIVDYIQYNWHHIRQSTPARFWNPTFDTGFETPAAHRLRLEVLFQFQLLGLTTALAPFSLIPIDKKVERIEMDANTRWRAIVQVAEGVVNIMRHWKKSYYARSEPFTCFVPWTTAVICKLEQCRLSSEDSTAVALFSSYVNILELALSEFSAFWELPTLLTDSLETVKVLHSHDIPPEVLLKIMAGCFGPLNNNKKSAAFTEDLKPGPEFPGASHKLPTTTVPAAVSELLPLTAASLTVPPVTTSDELYDPFSQGQLLNLPEEIMNFTFQSPFLEGMVDDWQFSFT